MSEGSSHESALKLAEVVERLMAIDADGRNEVERKEEIEEEIVKVGGEKGGGEKGGGGGGGSADVTVPCSLRVAREQCW
eukprot:599191-Hanusia_phi.AAC.6